MPVVDVDTQIHEYPMSKRGINIYSNILDLHPEECLFAQNVIWKNGIVKRGGQTLDFNDTEVVANKKILGIHRFYFTGGKQRLVACDTKVVKDDEDDTWTDVKTGLTTGLQTHFATWGALDKVYISNGTDRPFSYDGTTVINTSTSTLTVNSQPTAGQNSQVLITINETVSTGIEGTDWDVGVDEDATATDIAAWIDTLSGVGASATGSVVTVTPTATSDIEKFKWNEQGTDTAAMVTIIHLALPAKTLQCLAYQDRFLLINNNNKGFLNWSKSFTDSEMELRSATGVRPDLELFGMINHSLSNSDSGYDNSVLLAGASGMYLFQGTDLRTPSTTGNYVIHNLAINVGCNAPRTMVWTPKGSMWLGIDRKVYLLPFEASTPIPVSDKVLSTIAGVEGIENIPALHIKNACAVYHDGFYKLSVTKAGGTFNTNQWWLDVDRMHQDENKLFGPWYGPMTSQTIGVFANQNGPDDSGELIGGESNGKGYIYDLGKQTDDGDIDNTDGSTKAIQLFWQSYYNPLGNASFNKVIHSIEAELLDVLGTVNIDFHDITGSIKTGNSFGLSGSAVFWDDLYWDEFYWSNSNPTRQVITISPAINTRRLSVIIKHSIANDKFEIYSLKVEAKEQRKVFEGATFS